MSSSCSASADMLLFYNMIEEASPRSVQEVDMTGRLAFTVSGRIARPVHDVFEAVADPEQLSRYFTTNCAKGRLETGATVVWDFADFPGAFPVHVVTVEPDRRIVLRWQATDGGDDPYETTVTIGFESLDDGRTLVTITEEGRSEE